jgi:hypothetical protein
VGAWKGKRVKGVHAEQTQRHGKFKQSNVEGSNEELHRASKKRPTSHLESERIWVQFHQTQKLDAWISIPSSLLPKLYEREVCERKASV